MCLSLNTSTVVVNIPRLDVRGFDGLIDAFEHLMDVPDSVVEDALTVMETIAAKEIRTSGENYGVRDPESSVHVLDKIKVNKPKRTKEGGYADVTFSGTRTRNGKQTRNAEIAFINEYGKRNQQARPFVGEAMNKNAEKIVQAGANVIGEWMEKEFSK